VHLPTPLSTIPAAEGPAPAAISLFLVIPYLAGIVHGQRPDSKIFLITQNINALPGDVTGGRPERPWFQDRMTLAILTRAATGIT